MNIDVKGNSGCQVDVVAEGGKIFVYKYTHDKKYFARLVNQAKKQQIACMKEYQHIRIPEIYSVQENENATIIKMQYIYSKNFIEFFESAGFEQIDYLIGALKYFIDYEISQCSMQIIQPKVLQRKFEEVESRIIERGVINNLSFIDNKVDQIEQGVDSISIPKILDRCRSLFSNLPPIEIPVGVCHGDLTFSNILFNGNNYYLIDFLDSFLESPLLDIVKLRQDTKYGWSQLMYSKTYDAVRLGIIFNKIDSELDNYFTEKYPWYKEYYQLFQLMNFLRILPYACEERIVKFLTKTIEGILNDITNGNSDETDFSLINVSENKIHTIENKIKQSKPSTTNLIIPAAADKEEYNHSIPKLFTMAHDGVMPCIKALKSLNLNCFDKIYISILKKHDARYSLADMLKLQLKVNGIKNAEVVILDTPTTSQPETIYKTIKQMNIHGSLFIKDADCSFVGECSYDNAIAIYPLEQLEWVNPKNKSYVAVDDMFYITNVIEKCVVSHYFTAGGYAFKDTDTYCKYYEQLAPNKGLYLSHIIYSMLLDKHIFRPVIISEYKDFEERKV